MCRSDVWSPSTIGCSRLPPLNMLGLVGGTKTAECSSSTLMRLDVLSCAFAYVRVLARLGMIFCAYLAPLCWNSIFFLKFDIEVLILFVCWGITFLNGWPYVLYCCCIMFGMDVSHWASKPAMNCWVPILSCESLRRLCEKYWLGFINVWAFTG